CAWWMMAAGFVMAAPLLAVLRMQWTTRSVLLLTVSCAAETLYLVALAASYRRLDYTVAYPVARGSAPVFIALFAGVVLGECISPWGLVGILLVSAGILSLQARRGVVDRRLLALPLASGACIGCFSVADKAAVAYFSPLALVCLVFGGSAALLWPYIRFV